MRKITVALPIAILSIALISPAEASTPTSSIVNLLVTATSGNMPMSSNSKMTTAMTGSALGKFKIDTKGNTLCYLITSAGLSNMTEAHVQVTSTEKDVLIFNPKNINSTKSTCMKVSHTSLEDIAIHPSKYSFMVHTKANPDGAVMGTLRMGK